MRKTKTYQLNLIEPSDTFSPDPLNENAEKTEAKFAHLDASHASLAGRVSTLETHRIAAGTIRGNGSTQVINVGFTPIAVLVCSPNTSTIYRIATVLTLPDMPSRDDGQSTSSCYIVEGGFKLEYGGAGGILNADNFIFNYIAFA